MDFVEIAPNQMRRRFSTDYLSCGAGEHRLEANYNIYGYKLFFDGINPSKVTCNHQFQKPPDSMRFL
jgi:hypothetical protein